MEALTSLKFWKTKLTAGATNTTAGDCDESSSTVVDSVFSDPLTDNSDNDDDSLFELELTFPKPNHKPHIQTKPTPKPQSPVSILRAATPKLRIFIFGKLNKPKRDDSDNDTVSSLFTVKFNIEDGSIVPKFTRSNSFNLSSPKNSDEKNESSKRFVQKYFNRIKPLYSKSSKKFIASPTRSKTTTINKQFGKSKSASAVIGAPSPAIIPVRNDDRIESAILHCKRSLNSPKAKGCSSLSRCSSDPSHDKSIQMSDKI